MAVDFDQMWGKIRTNHYRDRGAGAAARAWKYGGQSFLAKLKPNQSAAQMAATAATSLIPGGNATVQGANAFAGLATLAWRQVIFPNLQNMASAMVDTGTEKGRSELQRKLLDILKTRLPGLFEDDALKSCANNARNDMEKFAKDGVVVVDRNFHKLSDALRDLSTELKSCKETVDACANPQNRGSAIKPAAEWATRSAIEAWFEADYYASKVRLQLFMLEDCVTTLKNGIGKVDENLKTAKDNLKNAVITYKLDPLDPPMVKL